jgi:hypothetical protein
VYFFFNLSFFCVIYAKIIILTLFTYCTNVVFLFCFIFPINSEIYNISFNLLLKYHYDLLRSLKMYFIMILFILIFYFISDPPTKPTFKITTTNETRQINVTTATIRLKERDNINMTCFSEGNPIPKYTWESQTDQIHETIRPFVNISRKDAGNYTCYASNVMKRTFGDTEHGLNSSSIYLDIMCKYKIHLIYPQNLIYSMLRKVIFQTFSPFKICIASFYYRFIN